MIVAWRVRHRLILWAIKMIDAGVANAIARRLVVHIVVDARLVLQQIKIILNEWADTAGMLYTYRYAAIAATLWAWHLKIATQQIGAILLLAGTRILQRAHAIRTRTQAESSGWNFKMS